MYLREIVMMWDGLKWHGIGSDGGIFKYLYINMEDEILCSLKLEFFDQLPKEESVS